MLILLYIMDSLRPDFLGCYGDRGAITPYLDSFAAQSTRFTRAYSLAPWSKASGAALFTGYLPRAVGMRELLARLPAGVPTLAERLAATGFKTVAVSANPFISHDFGMLRGFYETVEAFRPGTLAGEHFHFHANHFKRLASGLSVAPEALILARSPALHQALLLHLSGAGNEFALCWSMDTHAPFFVRGDKSFFGNPLERVVPAADPEWLAGGVGVREVLLLYRDMIAYQDEQFGALVAALQERGDWDNSLLVVAGDHGEAFGEHGVMGHGNGLWEEQVAVPLLIKFPHQHSPQICETPVSLMDLFSTLLAAVGEEEPVEHLSPIQGSRLQDVILNGATGRALLMEATGGWALREEDWKVLAERDEDIPLCFNLRSDPAEQRPLRDKHLRARLEESARSLQRSASVKAEQWGVQQEQEVDDQVLQRLRDLGYI